jgi:hypothetical protein
VFPDSYFSIFWFDEKPVAEVWSVIVVIIIINVVLVSPVHIPSLAFVVALYRFRFRWGWWVVVINVVPVTTTA